MSDWYVRAGVHEHGPISAKKLASLARSGQIKRKYLIRKGVDGTWQQADQVQEFFDAPESESLNVPEAPARPTAAPDRPDVAPDSAESSPPPALVASDAGPGDENGDLMDVPPVAVPTEPTGQLPEQVETDWSRSPEPPPIGHDAHRNEPPYLSTPPATQSMAANVDALPTITRTDDAQRPIPDGNSQGAGSVILGILSMILSVVPFVGMGFGLAGAWLGFRGRGIASSARVIPSGLTFAGMFVSVFGVLMSSISTVLFIVFFVTITSAIAAVINGLAGME